MERHSLSLFELNSMVRETIELSMDCEYWVEAELSEARENKGHLYLDLIQKDERSNTPIARASARCWKNKWMMIRPGFERTTGQTIHAGLKVLLKVYPQFHEAYGFSWIVTDIDPTYSLGDMVRRRMEIIKVLQAEGVFDLQKELSLPMFAQRIAVISSADAAGYGDFCRHLDENAYGLKFRPTLFPAVMQGEQVESSIIDALNTIYSCADDFDAVVIIRGGGATSDMSGFDTLALAENVANFPLPIITGIGHDRDECILDMVSHQRVKTPTAVADLLIDHLLAVLQRINDAQLAITTTVNEKMQRERMTLSRFVEIIPRQFSLVKSRQEMRLERKATRMNDAIQQRLFRDRNSLDLLAGNLQPMIWRKLTAERHRIEMLEQKAKALNPELLLKRGYSITLYNGKALKDTSMLKNGDTITTRLAKGTFSSTVRTTD